MNTAVCAYLHYSTGGQRETPKMTKEEKQKLAARSFTLADHKCTVAGYANPEATITADFPGFWAASWETVKRVADNGGNFTRADVRLSSWRWLGAGAELPRGF